ncbi:MAG: hypothetical protein H6756_09470 [Candidatus Omnitrophica bacterium]|nr:hypothetical protein [Candidatus Omnitrophota bacterium]
MDQFKTIRSVISVAFVALCVLHLASQRPLWLDETYVLRNIEGLGYAELFGPLKPAQSFPRVYLVIVKWLGSLCENHVVALRLLSFVFMVGAYFVWKDLYRRHCKGEPGEMTILLLSWLASYWLVYYAAELKPYSMDVLAAGLFMLFFLKQREYTARAPSAGMYLGALLLPGLLFFSYTAIFFFWIACYNFLQLSMRNKKLIPVFLLSSAASLACFALFYWTDVRHSITTAGVDYWESYFLCTKSAGCFFESFGEGIKRYTVFWWSNVKEVRRFAVGLIPVFLYGLVRFGYAGLKADNLRIFSLDGLAAVLFLQFFILGMLHKYPFTGQRITLFFAPVVFYLITRTLSAAREVKYLGKALHIYYIGYCYVALLVSVWTYIGLYRA